MDHPRPSLRLPADAGGRLLDDALAKRRDEETGQEAQSYRQHVTAVYDAWCGLVEQHKAFIDRVAARYDLATDRLLQSSLLCVALHDVGKLSKNFQAMMRAPDEAAKRKAALANYRHEIAALALVFWAANQLAKHNGRFPGDGRLEILAIAGHHKFLADGYLFDDQKFLQPLSWEPDTWTAISSAYALARAMFDDQQWSLPTMDDRCKPRLEPWLIHEADDQSNPPFDLLLSTRDKVAEMELARAARYRDLFVLLKGLLMTADWMASGAQGRDDLLDASRSVICGVSPVAVESHLRARQAKRRSDHAEVKLTDFQRRCAEAEGHIIAIAPTGSGKTEASWLWALGQVERGSVRKVLVLLPTMVTANSIYERLRAFFETHGQDVGLVHSTADLVRQAEDGDEADRADVRGDYLSESHFFRPVTVGTVDQLLVPLFHAGRWAMKSFAAADAAIVIDEVHAYEPHTLGLITLMIDQLRALGARFMVMSATMPAALREMIRLALTSDAPDAPAVGLIEDRALLEEARNHWTTCDQPLSEWIAQRSGAGEVKPSAEFLDLWEQTNERGDPQSILIVVNTVKRCQELAKALKDLKPICLHSKFIFQDRRRKEEAINRCPPRLLIATQVVEVSLDIDYDILLTECAPIDALIQRAGRVNRARRPIPGRVVIHPFEEGSEVVYGRTAGLLNATWNLCRALNRPPTEHDLLDLVGQAYEGIELASDTDVLQVRRVAQDQQRRLHGVLDSPRPQEDDALLKTRRSEYPQVSVIPECFAEAAIAAHPRDRRLYELKVPAWYAREHQVATDEIPICPMDYNAEYGAVLKPSSQHPVPNNTII